jgi:hypothetical protein
MEYMTLVWLQVWVPSEFSRQVGVRKGISSVQLLGAPLGCLITYQPCTHHVVLESPVCTCPACAGVHTERSGPFQAEGGARGCQHIGCE